MSAGTLHDELIDELKLLVDGLKDDTERGSAGREYLNGLLRDVYVLEETAADQPDLEDSKWLAPFVEVVVTKLEVGPRVLPDSAKAFEAAVERVADLRERNQLLGELRERITPVLDGGLLRPEAIERLERSGVRATLKAKRLLRSVGPPPEAALAARVLEGLALHLALGIAEGEPGERDDELKALCQRLEGWLAERVQEAAQPEVGATADERVLAVQGSMRAPGVRAGHVAQVVARGFDYAGQLLSHPVVVASAGSEARVLSTSRELLCGEDGPDEAAVARVLPYLEAMGAALTRRLEDPKETEASRGAAALDIVGAALPILETPEAQSRLLKALKEDFPGSEVELLLPTAGIPMSEGVGWEARDVFSRDVDEGVIVKLLRPGLKLGADIVRPALVQVSRGEPPPSEVLEEILELLPADEPRAQHLVSRLERARCASAGDAGAQLARELADLALYLRDDHLAEGARRALRLVIDEPPEALLEAEGWESVREFLDENLETLFEDGENGEIAVHRLTRPYLQGLRTHAMTGARLRALGESMNALLSLYDEQMGLMAREWLFSELERLSADGLPPGGHARRLMRTAAKSVGRFYKDGEVTPAVELTQALGRAGVQVFPEDEETLRRCPDPGTTFHRLECAYDEKAPRFQVMGAFEPAATTRKDKDELGVTETGAITVSLGTTPRLLTILASPEIADSRLGGASARLAAEVQALDAARLRGELSGDAGADRTFADGLATLFCAALEEGHWKRGDDGRAALGQLFECINEDYHLELLPGFLTYRRLKSLTDQFGDQIKVEVVREGPKEVTLRSIGALHRDELLRPLDMTWGVGEPPAYVAVLREALDWVDQVLEGKTPRIQLSPAATEAIQDFESPDAGSVEGVVRSLGVIVTWLANEVPDELEAFGKAVKNAPGLEFDFFPLPGQTYSSERILQAVEQASSPDSLSVVRDAAREDGQAVVVEQIAMLKDGRLIGEEPRARFAFKTLPQACESLSKALQPVLKSAQVARTVKGQLNGHLTRLALLPPGGDGEKAAQLSAFRTLLQARLIDPSYSDSPESKLHEAGAYLAGRLSEAGLLVVERFEGKTTVKEALASYSEDDVEIEEVFASAGSAELSEVRRPLAQLEGTTIQKGALMKAVPTDEGDVLEFDGVLVDTLDRLRSWIDGAGSLIEEELGNAERQILPRTVKRISDVRRKMLENQAASKLVLPPDTARRDLIRFVIDQVHRAEDTLSIQEDKSYRSTFGDAVFKEVVFRSAGPYLSNKYGISIDTSVVAGADTQALVGKFKKEERGPKPKVVNAKVYSVVVPCYQQEGVTIRPATIRVGVY
jgi:hypothetical protein